MTLTRDIDHGSRFSLGATDVGDGVNFSVCSKNASHVDVLLFDAVDAAKPARVVFDSRPGPRALLSPTVTTRTYQPTPGCHFYVVAAAVMHSARRATVCSICSGV